MKVRLEKKLVVAFCLSLSAISFAQDKDVHFEPSAEQRCRSEVQAVGCGTPTAGNQDSFFACIDQKILKLTEECREMHKSFSQARHAGH